MKVSKVLLYVGAMALVAAACGGGDSGDAGTTQPGNTPTTSAVDALAVAEGKRLFEGTCAACHGFDAQGIQGLGRPLVSNAFVAERSDADVVAFLTVGRAADHPDNTTGVAMPPRGGNVNLTDQDLGDIVAYLRTLADVPVAAPATTATTQAATTTTGGETTTTTGGDGEPTVIEVIGLDEAFSMRTIEVTAGEQVTIVFNNKDTSGEPHNFHLRTPDNDWFTQIAEAPDVQEITFVIAEPGEYGYFCDTHSSTMTGTLIVTSGS